jgi:uncharacterized membrane protein
MTTCGHDAHLMTATNTHRIFQVSLLFKGAFAAAEIVAGISAYFVTQQFLFALVERLMRNELLEDPRDLVASYLLTAVDHFSLSTRNFTAAYLLSHGVVKLWLIIGLLRGKLGYYPLAIAVFGAFIVYQLYRFTLSHSPWLVLITVVDAIVIGLTWHEYRARRVAAATITG